MRKIFPAILLGLAAGTSGLAVAGEADPGATKEADGTPAPAEAIETEIVVIGTPEDLERIPGSGQVITKKELEHRAPPTLNEAVRLVPGINVRTEDVSGTIPNIGLRGLNPDRSEKMHMLEDGVPVALSPYNENAAYYAPPVDRLERIEVLKGSGSILYGPQTVGGVMNFVTPSHMDDTLSGSARVSLGEHGYGVGHVDLGRRWNDTSFSAGVLRKQGDGFRGGSDFEISAATMKVIHQPTEKSFLTFKLNYFDQESSQTYLGLTPWLRENRGDDFNPAPDDLFAVERLDGLASYRQFYGERGQLLVNLFGSRSTRDWNRQDFARNAEQEDGTCVPPPSNTVATFGPGQTCGDTIYMRASFGARDRDFSVWGIEPRLIWEHDLFGADNEVQLGARYMVDEMTDERNNRATAGEPPRTRNRDVRTTAGYALFVQNTSIFDGRIGVTPGVRVEAYDQDRQFDIVDYGAVDVAGDTSNAVVLPGLGVTLEVRDGVTAFLGAHRGFSPPRTSEAIASDGADAELDEELSWNYELGLRGRAGKGAWYEATLFAMDFENQVIPNNQSGGAGTALVNAGETLHRGLEVAGGIDVGSFLEWDGRSLELSAGVTLLDAVFTAGIYDGNELVYAPERTAFLRLALVGVHGFSASIEALHVGEQFADPANTRAESPDGMLGLIPSYALVNLDASYRFEKVPLEVLASVDNALDERYVASRAPEGVFPGAFRQVTAGVRYRF